MLPNRGVGLLNQPCPVVKLLRVDADRQWIITPTLKTNMVCWLQQRTGLEGIHELCAMRRSTARQCQIL